MFDVKLSLEPIFHNERGDLRAGWRLLIYVALVALLAVFSGAVLRQLLHPTRGVFSPSYLVLTEGWSLSIVFGAALMMSGLEHRPFGAYGLPLSGPFGKRFFQGALLGLFEASALIGLIAAFGGYSFGELATHGVDALRWGTFWAFFFVLVGLFEEFTFRGYTLFTLTDGVGFWPAALILSALFAAVHLKNPGETPIGVSGVFLIGLVFAFSVRRTGSLWFAVGMHASFDFAETFLFSVPNSGTVFDGHLSNASLHGPVWLTGGSVGPEGSVFSFLTMGLVALAIHLLFPGQRQAQQPAEEFPAAGSVHQV